MKNQTVNILMVDDRDENLLALEAVLSSPNYRLISANSGEEALKWVLKVDFAVILLDVQMPGLDGYETARLIRSREKSKDIPIIFITALSQTQEHALKGYQAGAIDYIHKPYPPLVLKSKVEGFVQIFLSQRKIEEQKEEILQSSLQLKEAYQKLQQSEIMNRTITETAFNALFTLKECGTILTFNQSANRKFGYPDGELLDHNITELLPILKETPVEAIEKATLQETIGKRKDGSEFWAEFQITNVTIDNELLYVCSVRDITERKAKLHQLEELVQARTEDLVKINKRLEKEIEEKQKMVLKLKESEQKYKSLFDNHPDAVYSSDLEGRIVTCNDSAVKLTGRRKEELIGLEPIDTIVDKNDQEKTWWHFKEAVNGKPQNYDTVLIHKTGKRIDLNITNIPMVIDDEVIGVYGIAKDISLQKHLWHQLYESEEKYRQLVEGSPEAIIIQQIESEQWSFINETGLNLLGATCKEEVGDASPTAFFLHEEYQQLQQKIESIKTGQKIDSFESKITRLDGQIVDVLITCIPFLYQGVPSIHIVIRDITELKQSREIISQSDKLSMVGELAAGTAHEIRNPLTSLRGFTQLINSYLDHDNEFIPIMLEEIDRINTIVSELLLLSKPKQEEFERVHLGDLLANIVVLMNAQANLHGVEIKIEQDTITNLYIHGMENKIKQVFINLLKNSIEAMPEGGNITIKLSKEDSFVSIYFIDQGTGIPAELLDKIGRPFLTTKEDGTGLGMMVCQSIIDSHKGRMEIESEVGKGTTVKVHLPLCKEAYTVH